MSTPIRRICSGCCARTTSGHATAAPPKSVMNSRRLIASSEAQDKASYSPKLAYWKGVGWEVRQRLFTRPMSALGHKQTFAPQKVMSALPPKADMCDATRDVRFGPIADIAPEVRYNERDRQPCLQAAPTDT